MKPALAPSGNLLRPTEILRRYGICHRRRTQASCVQEFPFMVMSVGSVDGQWHLHVGDHRALPGDGQDDHVV
jgi:hypothetical protein